MTQHALIIGASRGIGLDLVRQYRADGTTVTATARDDAGLARITALGAHTLRLDVASATGAAGVAHLAGLLHAQAFDTVVFNAGVYGPRAQAMQAPSEDEFDAVMHTNVLGAMRVLPLLDGVLAPAARRAVMSSKMGSISSRSSSSGWLYRASKAALNSVLKDASPAFAGRAIFMG